MHSVTAFIALSALTMVAAQNSTEFTINVSEITDTERNTWCIAQENTCSELCANDPIGNTCDYTTLDYYCTCQNGSEPGLQYYTETIDYFVCEQAYSDCITEYENDQQAQANCTTSIADHCGTLDPSDATTSSSTTSSAASSGTASASGSSASGSSTAAASSTSTAGAVPTNIQMVGTGAAAAAFGLLAYML
ncbi:hypothetical protein M406DRAFT_356729 [Cryphonectria parasitica EP155]|uniref:DUF7707 domain-containing protein n=1 Tax=Cryphonectria parasitica (strain ATCC 38755 / EP155) TaxID=660469 RepID=A0A9P5CP88_CRYP1|nr:uncharacterized protein M406DRAFT_356729 [Cryphonectria parasitica EP155]KAF3764916.1 hypothetical protein M406DRAFT_356729 [Cryphonectria parasitica EP155]